MADTTTNLVTAEPSRFSIRLPRPLWIGLATVVLVMFGTGLRFAVPIYQQQVAIREIEKVGGQVYRRTVGPEWIRTLFGEKRMNLVDPIQYVHFLPDEATFHRRSSGNIFHTGSPPYIDGSTVDDVLLACVARVPNLQRLDLKWTNISDDGMRHLAGLHELRDLWIDGTDVSDASVQILVGLSNLEELSLRGTMITDAGIVDLKPLKRLKRLRLDILLLTPEAVQSLSVMPELEELVTGGSDFGLSKKILDSARRALPRVRIR